MCKRTYFDFSLPSALVLLLATAVVQPARAAEPAIHVLVASPEAGIAGSVTLGSERIDFESKLQGTTLRSEIRDARGRSLWLYVENLENDEAPFIAFDGHRFTGSYAPDVMTRLRGIASSPAGHLIRTLAFDLCVDVPGADLVAYRRGLETAYQAMQRGYPDDVQRQARLRHRPAALLPRDETAEIPKSKFGVNGGETEDYLFSEAGGYVVKTQNDHIVFANNMLSETHERVRKTLGTLPIQPQDDPHIGDSCFGMCGNGCTNDFSCRGFKGWSHEWVAGTVTGTTRAFCHCTRPESFYDPVTFEPICNTFVPGSFKTVTSSVSGYMVHTIRGWSSDGCVAHDACCRSSWTHSAGISCAWDVACDMVAVWAGYDCAAGIGWDVSWSYTAWETSSYTYLAGSDCRSDCGCDWSTPPIEVEP